MRKYVTTVVLKNTLFINARWKGKISYHSWLASYANSKVTCLETVNKMKRVFILMEEDVMFAIVLGMSQKIVPISLIKIKSHFNQRHFNQNLLFNHLLIISII